MNEFSEWPMEAEIEFLNDEGEWEHYAEIRSEEFAATWISKREDPSRWRATARKPEIAAEV